MTDLSTEFRALISEAERVSRDVGDDVREVLETGLAAPLPAAEARALLDRLVAVMRDRLAGSGDTLGEATLAEGLPALIVRIEQLREELLDVPASDNCVVLRPHDGISPREVKPSPVFHERRVAVMEGFVNTRDINLWDQNQRIDIHLNQFQQAHGRAPNSVELLDIMLGKMNLPGLNEDDQFEIFALARSIATNGVRKPPIIDQYGNLLDGNRRVTACYYILSSPDFDTAQKKRAEVIQVWQLTNHATDEDREAVVVSLNFESDHKQDWPAYVKARKVYEDWQARLALEGRASPTARRQQEIRKEIARKFALATDDVTKYIGMTELATEFEDYHVLEKNRDEYAVKHKAEKYFQYFDELGKGKKNGVLAALNEEEGFKDLVYDLLYDDKFKNFVQIRELKNVAKNEEALAYFREAAEHPASGPGLKEAHRLIEVGIATAKTGREMERVVSANKRVEVFTAWLQNAPVRIFQPGLPDALNAENLDRLYSALQLVEGYVDPAARRVRGSRVA
ncbi:hypothetical protein [uncultured Sphingomonas sp.]|uniref:hypothetical protein n=1 Tax=uncultured Sphingomonas sp. TaxID=158754 RepID=UPI0025D598E5|nr:hypothetical protein [uncultured Sphingomonas sp.]